MEETKPKGIPLFLSFEESMALKIEPIPCAWEGCKEESNKHCCGFVWQKSSNPCEKKSYCAHHFYRHLAKEHPTEARNRGYDEVKKLL